MEICDINHLHRRFLDIWEWCMRQGFDTRAFTYVENAFKSEPTAELVDRKTEQTERIKTHDYCDICNHKRCGNCTANSLDDYCVPSGYEPITKTETQNSNLTFEKDECAKEYEELGLKELKELIEADRKTEPLKGSKKLLKGKDEPQTDCPWK